MINSEAITTANIDEFRRNGATVIRGLLSAEELDRAELALSQVLAWPGPLHLVASDPAAPGQFVEDFRRWQEIAELRDLALSPALGAAAGLLMDASTVRLFHDHTLVKEAGTQQRTPWHQDLPYYNVDGAQNLSFWIPLDSVPLESTLEFIDGSHRGPWFTPRTFKDNVAAWFPEGELQELPSEGALTANSTISRWATEPGDVVAFHMLTLHSAGGFAGPGSRRVLSLRYLGEDMVHAPRPWRTSPPFPELDELPAGAKLPESIMPVVWTR